MSNELDFCRPSLPKLILEKLGLRGIAPADICRHEEALENLYRQYPDLAGDRGAIGPGDDGNCQSWRGVPGWWRDYVG